MYPDRKSVSNNRDMYNNGQSSSYGRNGYEYRGGNGSNQDMRSTYQHDYSHYQQAAPRSPHYQQHRQDYRSPSRNHPEARSAYGSQAYNRGYGGGNSGSGHGGYGGYRQHPTPTKSSGYGYNRSNHSRKPADQPKQVSKFDLHGRTASGKTNEDRKDAQPSRTNTIPLSNSNKTEITEQTVEVEQVVQSLIPIESETVTEQVEVQRSPDEVVVSESGKEVSVESVNEIAPPEVTGMSIPVIIIEPAEDKLVPEPFASEEMVPEGLVVSSEEEVVCEPSLCEISIEEGELELYVVPSEEVPLQKECVNLEPIVEVSSSNEPIVEVSSIPEPMVEVSSIPEPMVEVSSIPEAMVEVSSIPEPIAEVSSIPERMVEVSIPETMVEVSSIPEPIVEVSSIPEPIVEVSIPKPMVEVSSIPEPMAEVSFIPEPIVEVSSIPEPMIEVSSIPEPIVEVVSNPEPIVEVVSNPEPIVEVVSHQEPPIVDASSSQEAIPEEPVSSEELVMDQEESEQLVQACPNELPEQGETTITEELPTKENVGASKSSHVDEDITEKLDNMYITPSKNSRKSKILLDSTNIIESSSVAFVEIRKKDDPSEVQLTPVRRSTRKKTTSQQTPQEPLRNSARKKANPQQASQEALRNAKVVPNPFLK